MMQQYLAVRSDPQYAGYLLLFQMGGFLEAFFDDAAALAGALGISLTARGTHGGRPIPMAGVPLHAKDAYLARLVRAGVKVVICEQMEGHGAAGEGSAPLMRRKVGRGAAVSAAANRLGRPPAGGGEASASAAAAGGLLRRQVTRVVTRGTVVEDALLAPRANNYLAAVAFARGDASGGEAGVSAALAWVDVSTGDFFTRATQLGSLAADLAAFPPAELLVPTRSGGGVGADGAAADALLGVEDVLRAVAGGGAGASAPPPGGPSAKLLRQLSACVRTQARGLAATAASAAGTTRAPALAAAAAGRLSVDVAGGDADGCAVTLAPAGGFDGGGVGDAASHDALLLAHLPALEAAAARGLLAYVRWTQQGHMPLLRLAASLSEPPPEREGGASTRTAVPLPAGMTPTPPTDGAGAAAAPASPAPEPRALPLWDTAPLPHLLIDPSTRRALELTRPMHGRRRARGCLLHTIDLCVTAMGSRLLDARLCTPLASASPVHRRLDGVAHFAERPPLRESVRAALGAVPDLERTLQRVVVGRGAPRDLQQLRDGLAAARRLGLLLATQDFVLHHPPPRGLLPPPPAAGEKSGERAGPRHSNATDAAATATLRHSLAARLLPDWRGSPAGAAATLAPLLLAAARRDFDSSTPAPAVIDLATAVALFPLHAAEAEAAAAAATAAAAPGSGCGDGRSPALPPPLARLVSAYEALCAALVDGPGALAPPVDAAAEDAAAIGPLVGDGIDHAPGDAAAPPPAHPISSFSTPASTVVGFSLIRPGFDEQLDAARALRDGAGAELTRLADELRALTGVRSLRVRRSDEAGVTAEVPHKALPALHAFLAAAEERLAAGRSATARGRKAAAAGAPSAAGGGNALEPGAAIRVIRLSPDGGIAEVGAGAHRAALPPALPSVAPGLTDDELARLLLRPLRSLKSSARFTCPALVQLEASIAEAAARAAGIEGRILGELSAAVAAAGEAVSAVARAVAVVDVSSALAELAERYQLARPALVDGGTGMTVAGARHLVVERALMEGWADAGGEGDWDEWGDGGLPGAAALLGDAADDYVDRSLPDRARRSPPRSFTPNDIVLGEQPAGAPGAGDAGSGARAVVLCGPNMGGKSTYLRAAAHLVVLAQMGAYVPAAGAALGVVDRLFSRVGASDDVTRDRSTFLVEMEETAAILRQATARSFVVVDEVGRGTSAVDGLALAWAVLEHLAAATRCRTLFCTHIHELTALALAPLLAPPSAGGASGRGAAPPPATLPALPIRCLTMDIQRGPGGVPLLTHRVVAHPIYAHVAAAVKSGGGRGAGAAAAAMGSLDVWRQLTSLSHGVHVAGLAGVPPAVCARASALLARLDQSHASAVWAQAVMQLGAEEGGLLGGGAGVAGAETAAPVIRRPRKAKARASSAGA